MAEIHTNRWYTNFGPLNERFETEMAMFLEQTGSAKLGTGTFSSATTALELMLRAKRLGEGAKVLIPVLTFPATALSVLNASYKPVFADVDKESWLLTPEIARKAHSKEPLDAVVPVATYGKPLDGEAWLEFQKETGVHVFWDAAAVLGQQKIPQGITAVFSLHATKPFGVGEGGLVATNDLETLDRARSLSNFGFIGPAGVVQQTGTNAKFGEYYAAVGLQQIARWPEVIERRKNVADAYWRELKKLGNRIELQAGCGDDFIPATLQIYAKDLGKQIFDALAAAGIQTRRWYLPLLHEHPALKDITFVGNENVEEAIPVSLELAEGLVGLPFHAFLSDEDIIEICNVVAEVVS
ncbi:DegT/DnrJ/EryC1/StrS family aminotransferase [Kordiimonas sp. SCSIO 12603]|uniref:DegT/DnrJ/EryC1/StrS family aminotransferase n=1 Tax=Kordiimonas sp. SCSIO 12603 TaxID=2829596 RepID=UPI0021048C6F|nr:DegT/DnrJ/EryC1/StrS family aminotransferase [Kordiimonas sp. SCSIO 12603]UTW60050.1 DegT/DnrJ/EryC1/StrS family aminotransferase [Kordiimonas sp. SCSIO 12603]